MATAKMVQEGDTLVYPSAIPIAANTIVRKNRYIGVVLRPLTQADIDEGRDAELTIEGVFTFPKATGITIVQGQPLYWSDGSANLSNVSTSRNFAGFAAAGAASAATVCDIKLAAMDS